MRYSQLLRTGIDIHLVSRLSIHHLEQSHIGQLLSTRVVYLDAHHIMLLVGNLQGMLVILLVVEVADEEGGAVAFHHAGEVFQGATDVGALALRMEVEHLPDDIEDMLSSLLGRDILLNSVGKEDDTYLVVVLNGTEGQGGSYLGCQVALHLAHRTEVERATHIHEQHDGELSFLFEHLDERAMETGCHVPVDVSHVVAILVFAHLGKGHSPALEG